MSKKQQTPVNAVEAIERLGHAIRYFEAQVHLWHEPGQCAAAMKELPTARQGVTQCLADVHAVLAGRAFTPDANIEELHGRVTRLLELGYRVVPASFTVKARGTERVDFEGHTRTRRWTIKPNLHPIDLDAFSQEARALGLRLERLAVVVAKRAAGEQNKTDGGHRPADSPPALHRDDLLILQALDKSPTTMTQTALEDATRRTRKHIGARLKHLLTAGFVHYPAGPRGGVTMTPAGKEIVQGASAPVTH